MFFSVVFRL